MSNDCLSPSPKRTARHRVALDASDTIPNKDFVLRYSVAGDAVKTALLTHRDRRGAYFTFMLEPPAQLEAVARTPVEFIFVLDCSGSMDGYPIAAAKAAALRGLAWDRLRQRKIRCYQVLQLSLLTGGSVYEACAAAGYHAVGAPLAGMKKTSGASRVASGGVASPDDPGTRLPPSKLRP